MRQLERTARGRRQIPHSLPKVAAGFRALLSKSKLVKEVSGPLKFIHFTFIEQLKLTKDSLPYPYGILITR